MSPKAALAKLGVAYAIAGPSEESSLLTLEQLLLAAMPLIKDDLKAMCLAYTWLCRFSGLLSEERLLAAFTGATGTDARVAAGLLLKACPGGFKRFRSLALLAPLPKNGEIARGLSRHAEAGRCPFDPEMLSLGVMVSQLEQEDEKKLRPRRWVEAQARLRAV
jgi:hypothetical protein